MAVVAQFPLGTVLFPTMVLPLHVFEPRYRALARDVLAGDGRFGVPLIERGSEVGGGDTRSDVGTIARVVQAEETPDGRWMIVAVGISRFRVVRWLVDDPYPLAEIEDWPDDDSATDDELYRATVAALRRALALANELGESTAPSTFELSPDPATGSFQIATLAPLTALDKQGLLRAPSAAARIELAHRSLVELHDVLTLRLGMDAPDDGG